MDTTELVALVEAGDAEALARHLWTMPIEELEQLAASGESDGVQ